ncbi:MAG: hypothetical protein ACD_8C00124G0037 [uncultured bacterium]|nr:MAG: hypothetical protein ACD_8C00124G0037 [uncultured bacterium]
MSENIFSHIPVFFREKVEELFDINRQYSEKYLADLDSLDLYKAEHPTQVIVFKCSDGRLMVSRFAEMPLGFLETFRNLGGKFNWGWNGLNESVKGLIRDGYIKFLERRSLQSIDEQLRLMAKRQNLLDSLRCSEKNYKQGGNTELLKQVEFSTLIICTYHFSRGDNKTRGCKASNFDIEQSIRDAKGFRMNIEKAYQGSRHKVFAIVFGMDTDDEFFVLHGENGQKRDLANQPENVSVGELFALICELYPSMSLQMKLDLLPILQGNIKHGSAIRKSKRPIEEMTHGEWILGICKSRPSESITVPNTAVLVGLLNPELSKVIRIGLDVIKPNAPKGFLLLTAACYGGDETETSARQEAKYYSRLAMEQASEYRSPDSGWYPELKKFMYPLPLLVNNETKLFEMIRPRKKNH